MAIARMPVNISWGYGTGSPGANIWHLRTTGDFPSDTEAQGLSEIVEGFYSALANLFHVSWRARFDGEISGLGTDTGATQTIDPWEVLGGQAGEVLPTSNQIVVGWRSSTGGRRGRGRTFLGPLHAGVLAADSLPTTDAIDDVQAAADALVSASTGFTNGALGVYSRTDDLVRDFTSATVRREFAVLRTRRD